VLEKPGLCVVFVCAFVLPLAAHAALTVDLQPSAASPQPLATDITWTASASGSSGGTVWYSFRARALADAVSAPTYTMRRPSPPPDFTVVRDFGPQNALDWTATEHEGVYEIEASARDLNTGETAVTISRFEMLPLATQQSPVVTSTWHPLVFIYSAPACPLRGSMRVDFTDPTGVATSTPSKSCNATQTMNFQIAGLLAQTTYTAHHVLITSDGTVVGPDVSFTTGALPDMFKATKVLQSAPAGAPAMVLLMSPLAEPPLAMDLAGNVLWYYIGGVNTLTRPAGDGKFFGILENPTLDSSNQFVREFDLLGYTLKETNAARVSEQLQALGHRPITGFHHEARLLPDGKILTLGCIEQILTNVQGPGDVDVLGDMIMILDQELNVVWAWDAFDHLDNSRLATLGETCTVGGGGCSPFYKASVANDWLHGNSLQLTPDGNILYSIRHQDWLIKIDYAGRTGQVLWKLGKDGDFTFASTDPYPYFSHQHDGQIAPDGTVTVFDDGNVRWSADNSAHSRGQVLVLDESTMTASLKLNADMGAYSYALGSAALLSNGDYHFDIGIIYGPGTGRSIEVDPSGNVIFEIETVSPVYRSFRLGNLYLTSY